MLSSLELAESCRPSSSRPPDWLRVIVEERENGLLGKLPRDCVRVGCRRAAMDVLGEEGLKREAFTCAALLSFKKTSATRECLAVEVDSPSRCDTLPLLRIIPSGPSNASLRRTDSASAARVGTGLGALIAVRVVAFRRLVVTLATVSMVSTRDADLVLAMPRSILRPNEWTKAKPVPML